MHRKETFSGGFKKLRMDILETVDFQCLAISARYIEKIITRRIGEGRGVCGLIQNIYIFFFVIDFSRPNDEQMNCPEKPA